MPGLLQSPKGKFGSFKVITAVIAEFLGTMLFTAFGTTTPQGVTSTQQGVGTTSPYAANWAPWGNGFSLALAIYATANVSGGHINPAVTAATMVTGHIDFFLGLAYIVAQLSGACVGILLVAGLIPGVSVGMGNAGVGCFHSGSGIGDAQLFGWELVMTFVLVAIVYAVAIGEPNFGIVGPLVVGLSLFTMVFAGSQYTGTAINPARAFGPAAVYHCYWNEVWIYALAEFSGGIIAGIISCPLYGVGSPILKYLFPWMKNDKIEEGTGSRTIFSMMRPSNAKKSGDIPMSSPAAKHNRPTDEAPIMQSHNDREMARARGTTNDLV